MTRRISDREWGELSAYLDGQISPKEKARIEQKLSGSPDLRSAYEDLRRMRTLLRSQPRLRAPRNFTLTAEIVRQTASHQPTRRLSPVFGLVSALASFLLILVIAGEFLVGDYRPAAAPVSMQLQTESMQVEKAAPTGLIAPAAQAEAQDETPPEQPAQLQQSAPQANPTQLAEQPLSQESYEANGEDTLTQAAPQAGIMAYPAPAATVAGEVALQSPEQTPTPQPTIAASTDELQETEAISMAAPEEAVEQPEARPDQSVAQQPFWNGWRVTQVLLLALALICALVALYFRRAGMR